MKPGRGRARSTPEVRKWQAERARKAARPGTDPARARRFEWPADKTLILETLAAAKDGERTATRQA